MSKGRCCQPWCVQASLAVLFQLPHTGSAIPMLCVAEEAEAPAAEPCREGLGIGDIGMLFKGAVPDPRALLCPTASPLWAKCHPLQLSTKHLCHSPTVYSHFCTSARFFWLQTQPHLQGFIFLFDTLLLIFPYCTKELAPVPLSQLLLCSK